jgi:hypothetical protein
VGIARKKDTLPACSPTGYAKVVVFFSLHVNVCALRKKKQFFFVKVHKEVNRVRSLSDPIAVIVHGLKTITIQLSFVAAYVVGWLVYRVETSISATYAHICIAIDATLCPCAVFVTVSYVGIANLNPGIANR